MLSSFINYLILSLLLSSSSIGSSTIIEYDDDDFEGERRFRRSLEFYKTGKELARNMGETLDDLLKNYSNKIRPGWPGPPCKIILNLSVHAIGPVDEKKQAFKIDAYFRQKWNDPRLSFNASGGVAALPLNWQMLNKIWKPDTFFLNGKKSKMHKITVPNRFLRITPDGTVSYSQRLTISARCPMHLRKYPFDSQVCPLTIGSYAYSADEVIYVWKANPLSVGDELGMTQFHLVRWTAGEETNLTKRKIASGFRNDSIAYLNFYFERQTGYFLLQIYTPLLIIVMCSWVSFWIVKTDTPSRVGLGIASTLSVTKIGFAGKGKPNVEYATALDVFIIICFMTVFLGLIEFALMNFITIFINRYKAKEEAASEKIKAEKEKLANAVQIIAKNLITLKPTAEINHEIVTPAPLAVSEKVSESPPRLETIYKEKSIEIHVPEESLEIKENSPVSRTMSSMGTMTDEIMETATSSVNLKSKWNKELIFEAISKYSYKMGIFAMTLLAKIQSLLILPPICRWYIYTNTQDALDTIDEKARKYFPLTFIFTMSAYIIFYFYILDDEVINFRAALFRDIKDI